MAHERAGQQALPEDLIDVDAVVSAYYDRRPDPSDPSQQVAFGTSGHRGSSLDSAFNEAHIVATTQAIVEYRAEQGVDGPLLIGRDTHALSEPAWQTAVEVLLAAGVTVLVDERDGFTPTPAVSHAILRLNRRGQARPGRRASSSRRRTTHHVTVASSTTLPTADPPTPTRPAGSRTGPTRCSSTAWTRSSGVSSDRARAEAGRFDFLSSYIDDLAGRAGPRRDPFGRGADRCRPDGGCERRLLG